MTIDGITIRVGQLWADRDSREAKRGTRQRLRIFGMGEFVSLNNEDTGVISRVKPERLVRRFQLVEERR